MKRNVGTVDRVARSIVALGLFACAFLAPFSLGVRVAAFSLPAAYLLFTALAGTCLGYSLMGRTTACAVPRA